MNILVVDDDAMVLESCRRILGAEGMRVDSAPDAAGALDLVNDTDRPFDLIITDIKMPGQDGFSLLSKVRELRPGLAVLVMTGYLVGEIRRQGQTLGANCLAKPFTPDELITAVRSAVAAAAAKRSIRQFAGTISNPNNEETPNG